MHLFFDLDGTITDSSPGIIRCINHALVTLGHDRVPDGRLRTMIGPPLTTIFQTVLGSVDEAVLDRAVVAYRTRFDDVGIFENALFPGMADAIDELHRTGHTLQIVTAKPAVTASRVLAHFEMARFFDAVHGPALGARSCNKADLVATALQAASGDRQQAMMIGDRADDVLAARAHGVPAVAVAWGYGSRQELVAARPAYVAESATDLLQWVHSAG